MNAPMGEHGGRVTAEFTAGGHQYRVGDVIDPETAKAWPWNNRRAMANSMPKLVEWFNRPSAEGRRGRQRA